jgi:hypothetical protein
MHLQKLSGPGLCRWAGIEPVGAQLAGLTGCCSRRTGRVQTGSSQDCRRFTSATSSLTERLKRSPASSLSALSRRGHWHRIRRPIFRRAGERRARPRLTGRGPLYSPRSTVPSGLASCFDQDGLRHHGVHPWRLAPHRSCGLSYVARHAARRQAARRIWLPSALLLRGSVTPLDTSGWQLPGYTWTADKAVQPDGRTVARTS